MLMHYDTKLPIHLAGDASNYGIGSVLSQVDAEGQGHPIAFASRTLSVCEENYSQVEKEAFSLIFGIRKFHKYVYGRHFTLVTDHRPLTTLFGSKSGFPPLAAGHLQRWALLLIILLNFAQQRLTPMLTVSPVCRCKHHAMYRSTYVPT